MPTIKIVELIGTSPTSFEDAVQEAVTRAGKNLRNISGVDVIGQKASVEDGKISEYRAHVKVAFKVE